MADRISAIEERLAKATPGPWEVDGHYLRARLAPGSPPATFSIVRLEADPCDADLIANAPSDLRYLLDALRESREELDEAVRLLDDIDGAMSLGSVRRGVALMQDVAQADWVFGTLKKIRAYLAPRHPEVARQEERSE